MAKEKRDKKKQNPFVKVLSKNKKTEQVLVLYLRTSGGGQWMWITPESGMFQIKNKIYHDKKGTDWTARVGVKNINFKIIPEWSMYPIGPKAYLKTLKSEEASVQYDMIRAIQTAETVKQNEGKLMNKINPKVAIIIILAIIVVVYLIMQK